MPRSSDAPVLVLFEIGFVGDSIMTLPAMEALRRAQPDARIVRVINRVMFQLWEGCPLCDELVPHDRSAAPWTAGPALLRRLRALRPALFANLHTPERNRRPRTYWRDALFALGTGARRRLAWSQGAEATLLTDAVPRERFGEANMSVETFRVLEPLGLELRPERVSFWHDDSHRRLAREQLLGALPADEPFLAVAPFGKDPEKELEEAELGELLAACWEATGLRPVLLGGPGDEAKMSRLRPHLRIPHADLVGRNDLKTAAALLESASAVLAVDSGLMHLAALVRAPVVALFGPMPLQRWRPFRDEAVTPFVGRTRGGEGAGTRPPFDHDAIARAVAKVASA